MYDGHSWSAANGGWNALAPQQYTVSDTPGDLYHSDLNALEAPPSAPRPLADSFGYAVPLPSSPYLQVVEMVHNPLDYTANGAAQVTQLQSGCKSTGQCTASTHILHESTYSQPTTSGPSTGDNWAGSCNNLGDGLAGLDTHWHPALAQGDWSSDAMKTWYSQQGFTTEPFVQQARSCIASQSTAAAYQESRTFAEIGRIEELDWITLDLEELLTKYSKVTGGVASDSRGA
ncbi:hypothetical protein BC628DRAFT_1421513 [Trametes gibbosa]|nr:hypothetical protein BC628DRAFT_1421513 [Trametes gibbosa]